MGVLAAATGQGVLAPRFGFGDHELGPFKRLQPLLQPATGWHRTQPQHLMGWRQPLRLCQQHVVATDQRQGQPRSPEEASARIGQPVRRVSCCKAATKRPP